MLFIDILYFLLLLIILPFSPKYLFKKEYRQLLKKRLKPEPIPISNKKRIWIHAVSVGEVKSLKKLLEEMKKIKHIDIILSVTTPTGYKIAKKEYNQINVIMAPIDFSFTIKKFIKIIKPNILILNELELWPNQLLMMNKSKIPILLINGRVSITAMARYIKFRFILKFFLTKIELFMVQAEIYSKRFIELGVDPEKIKICGNIKADEAINAANRLISSEEILKYLKIVAQRDKIIVCASTHKSDEEIIFPILLKLFKKYSIILVPRHPDRVEDICKNLESSEIKYQIWSQASKVDLQSNVLIFDKIGYLFNILSIADTIIMGGTFEKKIGGHNLYEPAILGKNIIGGPNFNNFPAIGEELIKEGIYKTVDSSEKMYDATEQAFNSIGKSTIAKELIRKRKGSIECIIKEIQKKIN